MLPVIVIFSISLVFFLVSTKIPDRIFSRLTLTIALAGALACIFVFIFPTAFTQKTASPAHSDSHTYPANDSEPHGLTPLSTEQPSMDMQPAADASKGSAATALEAGAVSTEIQHVTTTDSQTAPGNALIKKPSISLMHVFSGGGEYDDLAFTPDGAHLAAASGWKSPVVIWDTNTFKVDAHIPSGSNWVSQPTISPDGRILATGHSNHKVKLWTVSGEPMDILDTHSPVYSLSFSSDGHLLAAGCAHKVIVWDLASKMVKTVITGIFDDVRAVAFSPDGRYLATGGDSKTVLWELPAAHKVAQQVSSVYSDCFSHSLSFSIDGSLLAGGCDNGRVWIADVSSGRLAQFFTIGSSGAFVSFSPAGDYLAVAGSATLELREATINSSILVSKSEDSGREFHGLTFSRDGLRLATSTWERGHSSEVKIWNIYR